jgi:hypothetical protein
MKRARSILGRLGEWERSHESRELDSNLFPYQELRKAVLVWHTTCIRKEQKSREQGAKEQELGAGMEHRPPTADACPLILILILIPDP